MAKRGLVYQHGTRAVDDLVKYLGLERDSSVQTPGVHGVT